MMPASLETLNDGVAMVAGSWSDLSAHPPTDESIDVKIQVAGLHISLYMAYCPTCVEHDSSPWLPTFKLCI